MLTSDVQDSTREECLSLGAQAFLNKPVKAEELIPVITSLITKES
jgi:twitching motility two-component system response regulator PilH